MAQGSFNLLPVVARWWSGDGRRGLLWYVALPLAVGGSVLALELEADNLGAFLTGSIFFTGLLLNIMFRVYGWSADAATDVDNSADAPIGQSWQRERARRRLKAIGRLYDSLTWATLVSLGLVVVLVVLNTEATPSQRGRDLVVTTAVMGSLGTHLLLVLLTIINRLFIITGTTVRRHQSKGDRR